MAKDKKNKPKKKRWWSYLGEAYQVSKVTYPWAIWAILGAGLLGLGLGILGAIATRWWFLWVPLAIFLGLTFSLLVLARLVRRATYSQIDGRPGATLAVLTNIKRGWVIDQEPVRFNARTQDMVYRAIGRAGIVLVTEGPAERVGKLVTDEKRAIKRVAPSAPVSVIMVGNGEKQTKLIDLERTMKKLPKVISHQEVAAVSARMKAIQTNSLPIPKGVDPMNMRPDRKAMRGR